MLCEQVTTEAAFGAASVYLFVGSLTPALQELLWV